MNGGRSDANESAEDRHPPVDGPGERPAEDRLLTAERRERLGRVGHVAGVVCLIAIVLPFVVYAVPQLVGAESSYVVLSGSMEPAMGPGDVTFVEDVPAAEVTAGDVINYERPAAERTTTHRVTDVLERSDGSIAFETKGDNNEDPDLGVVAAGEYRGRVKEVAGAPLVIPLVGYVLQFTSSGPGFVLLFVVPVVLLIANEVWNVLSSVRHPESEADGADGSQPDSTGAGGITAEIGHAGVATGESYEAPPRRPADTEPASSQTTPTTEAADRSAATDPTAVTFRPAELRLGIGILAAFVAYSIWVAATNPGAFTISVAGSATVGLLMLGGLYWQGPAATDSTATDRRTSARDGLTVRPGTLAGDSPGFTRKPVPSLAALVDLAVSSDGQLYRRPDGSRYHVSVGTTIYVSDVDEGAPPADAATAWTAESVAGESPPLDADTPEKDSSGSPRVTGGGSGSDASDRAVRDGDPAADAPAGSGAGKAVPRMAPARNEYSPDPQPDTDMEADDD